MSRVRPYARALLRAVALACVAALAAVPAPAGAALGVTHVGATLAETTGNGDGLVGPGETFALTERIRHTDLLVPAFTGVSAMAFEAEPDLTMFQSTAGYQDMTYGQEAGNARPFTGVVSVNAECGDAYDFRLDVLAAQGQAEVPFRVTTGAPGPPSAYESLDVPKTVADLTTVDSTLEAGAPGRVKELSVRVGSLRHTATGDVKIELVAPSGASVVLVDAEGEERDNFTSTVFSDSASQRIEDAPPPFTGSFRPEQPLSTLAGENAQGTWRLRVTDQLGSDEGALESWGLDVRTAVCDGRPIASFTASPAPVLPGGMLTLDATGSTDPNGSIVRYEWDLDGDGAYDDALGATTTTSFALRGRYAVSLRVTDDIGGTGTRTMNVSVTDPPVATFTATPASPLTAQDTVLDASASIDPDGPPLSRYEWDLDGDGEFERDGGPTAATTAQWASPGTRTVRVRVTDEDGASATHAVDVVVRNRPPVPSFTHPRPAIVGAAVTFDAGGSTDPDTAIARYEWDFDGDGTFEVDGAGTATVQHTFAVPGDVTVGLRVTDAAGAAATTTRSVSVTRLPVPSFTTTPNPVSLQRPVTFDAAASTDPDGTIVRYEWDLDGDATFETDTGATAAATRAYSVSGTYAVGLRVTDDDGAQATTTVSLVSRNVAPLAAIAVAPSPVTAGQPVTLDARGSGDPDGSVVKYDWDLDGNGSYEASSGASPTRAHTYPNPGGFTVGVRVTDNHGAAATATAKLVVLAPAVTGGTGGSTPGGSTGGAGTAAGGEPGTSGDGALPERLRATLTGSPLQRAAGVVSRGLSVGCHADRAARCVLRAELRAADARRLGLRARRGRPVVVGRVTLALGAAGTRAARLRLTVAGRRALRRTRRVAIVVRATADAGAAGGRSSLVRTFLVRR